MSRYGIKDVFCTLQGEGMRAGTKAVFTRFTGCNLWDGHPLHRDRGLGACSRWCDTDFFKGKALGVDEILAAMGEQWTPFPGEDRWCVLTGGEPCLQIDRELMMALKDYGWKIAIETNGTEENESVVYLADHICIAPKLGLDGQPLPLALSRAEEIKVVLPGAEPGKVGWTEEMLVGLESQFAEAVCFVQPQDPLVDPMFVSETALLRTQEVDEEKEYELNEQLKKNIKRCIRHVMAHPTWRLSFQVHKMIGLP